MPPLVLIIEDDYCIRILFEKLVERAACQPLGAASGEEALEILHARQPEIVLLDLGLPGIGGEEILRFIRSTPHLQHTRIAIISAYPQAASENLRRQADHVLTKPVLPSQLVTMINTLLNT